MAQDRTTMRVLSDDDGRRRDEFVSGKLTQVKDKVEAIIKEVHPNIQSCFEDIGYHDGVCTCKILFYTPYLKWLKNRILYIKANFYIHNLEVALPEIHYNVNHVEGAIVTRIQAVIKEELGVDVHQIVSYTG